jgi:peptidoglycan/xylan/chitin deacetylase (PgdA/CDA1 family)
MTTVENPRFAYSALPDRPDFTWPGGKRLAVYIGLNIECFSFASGLGARLAAPAPPTDVLNYAWRAYGNRVGLWRMLDIFDDLGLPCTALVNSDTYAQEPGVIEALRARGYEIAGHGRTNAEQQGVLSEPDEKALIADATQVIAAQEGRAPKGWLGPWISQSATTPDLLHESGYEYLLDWSHDEQPTWMATRTGRILSVPYAQELNDIPQIVVRQKEAKDFADMVIDGFQAARADCARHNRSVVFSVALHTYLMGQLHRLPHLDRCLREIARHRDEIWWATAGEINDHFRSLE